MKTIPGKIKISCIKILIISIVCTYSTYSQESMLLRPYFKIGVMATPPNTVDLEYSVDGIAGGMDDKQSVRQLVIGLGCQLMVETNKPGLSLGGEIGMQNLFHSRVDGALLRSTYYSYHIDREWELYINPLVGFTSEDSPFFFQGGLGLHLVFWDWQYRYSSIYETTSNSNGGSNTNLGLMLKAGTLLNITPSVSLPVALRTDILFRYGGLISVSLIVGFDYKSGS